jgi:hypothetical protein
MKILQALGWGLFILMLQFLVPKIFSGLQDTLLAFFNALQSALAVGNSSMKAGVLTPFVRR